MAIVFSAKITGVSVENLYSTGNYYTGQSITIPTMRLDTELFPYAMQDSRSSGEVSQSVFAIYYAASLSESPVRLQRLPMPRIHHCSLKS